MPATTARRVRRYEAGDTAPVASHYAIYSRLVNRPERQVKAFRSLADAVEYRDAQSLPTNRHLYAVYPDGSRKLLPHDGAETGFYTLPSGDAVEHVSRDADPRRHNWSSDANRVIGTPDRNTDRLLVHLASMTGPLTPLARELADHPAVAEDVAAARRAALLKRDPFHFMVAADMLDDAGVGERVAHTIRRKVTEHLDRHRLSRRTRLARAVRKYAGRRLHPPEPVADDADEFELSNYAPGAAFDPYTTDAGPAAATPTRHPAARPQPVLISSTLHALANARKGFREAAGREGQAAYHGLLESAGRRLLTAGDVRGAILLRHLRHQTGPASLPPETTTRNGVHVEQTPGGVALNDGTKLHVELRGTYDAPHTPTAVGVSWGKPGNEYHGWFTPAEARRFAGLHPAVRELLNTHFGQPPAKPDPPGAVKPLAMSRRKYAAGKPGTGSAAFGAVAGAGQERLHAAARDIARALDLEPARTRDALHDSPQGSRPAVAQRVGKPDAATARYAAAWYGLLSRSPGLAVFRTGDGPDRLHRLYLRGSGQQARRLLDAAGIPQRVLLPTRGGHDVLVYDQGGGLSGRMQAFARQHRLTLKTASGTGEVVGAADPKQARAKFRELIAEYEQGGRQ